MIVKSSAISFGVFLAGLSIGEMAAAAVQIAPHRAVYEMRLAKGRAGDIADVNGLMMFEWADSCDGWTVTQRSRMTFLYHRGENEAEEVEVGWTMNSWESKDGLRYRFSVRKLQDGAPTDEIRGEAHLDSAGGPGKADYTSPETRELPLPPGTLFPTQHSLQLLERADAGTRMFWSVLFDGSDKEGLFEVSAVVAKRVEPEPQEADKTELAESPLLTAGPAYRIGLAFFPRQEEGTVPEHEQFLRMRSNGVVDQLTLDYGNFSVDAKLVDVDPLPAPDC